MAQIVVSGVAHFFVVVGGSKIHERLAHFFVDVYSFIQESSIFLLHKVGFRRKNRPLVYVHAFTIIFLFWSGQENYYTELNRLLHEAVAYPIET